MRKSNAEDAEVAEERREPGRFYIELAPPYVQTELGGARQLTDSRATPLADYIAEVMQLLVQTSPPDGEILVERVKTLRWAERDGTYPQVFAALNAM